MEGVLRAGVRFIDNLLSVSQGIKEFTQDPDCILRIQLCRASHTLELEGVIIMRGEPVLAIHAWNERMPRLPPAGADLEWALTFRRQVIYSFGLVANRIREDSRYSRVRAVCGSSALFSFTGHSSGMRLMQNLGFTVLPYYRPLGRFGEFWENLFSWWLMWAYNKTSLRSREFRSLQRTEIWITVDNFLQRYGLQQAY